MNPESSFQRELMHSCSSTQHTHRDDQRTPPVSTPSWRRSTSAICRGPDDCEKHRDHQATSDGLLSGLDGESVQSPSDLKKGRWFLCSMSSTLGSDPGKALHPTHPLLQLSWSRIHEPPYQAYLVRPSRPKVLSDSVKGGIPTDFLEVALGPLNPVRQASTHPC